MHVTPQSIAAAYTFLRDTYAPFRCLPPADAVEFHATQHRDRYGDWSQWMDGYRDNAHIIRVSSELIGSCGMLLAITAHEMVHAVQAIKKTYSHNAEHNADFNRRKRACARFYGWDEKAF